MWDEDVAYLVRQLCTRAGDLPPSEWSKMNVILDREGDWECHRRGIGRRR